MDTQINPSCLTDQIHIRGFESDDCPAIAEIYDHSKLDELINEGKTFELLPLKQDSKRLAELKQSDVYIYDHNGVRAYGAIYQSELRALFVHSNSRGKGICKTLLEFLLSKLTPSPIDNSVTLNVAKSNLPAKALYAQYGFKVIEEFEAEYNGVSVQANIMRMKME